MARAQPSSPRRRHLLRTTPMAGRGWAPVHRQGPTQRGRGRRQHRSLRPPRRPRPRDGISLTRSSISRSAARAPASAFSSRRANSTILSAELWGWPKRIDRPYRPPTAQASSMYGSSSPRAWAFLSSCGRLLSCLQRRASVSRSASCRRRPRSSPARPASRDIGRVEPPLPEPSAGFCAIGQPPAPTCPTSYRVTPKSWQNSLRGHDAALMTRLAAFRAFPRALKHGRVEARYPSGSPARFRNRPSERTREGERAVARGRIRLYPPERVSGTPRRWTARRVNRSSVTAAAPRAVSSAGSARARAATARRRPRAGGHSAASSQATWDGAVGEASRAAAPSTGSPQARQFRSPCPTPVPALGRCPTVPRRGLGTWYRSLVPRLFAGLRRPTAGFAADIGRGCCPTPVPPVSRPSGRAGPT